MVAGKRDHPLELDAVAKVLRFLLDGVPDLLNCATVSSETPRDDQNLHPGALLVGDLFSGVGNLLETATNLPLDARGVEAAKHGSCHHLSPSALALIADHLPENLRAQGVGLPPTLPLQGRLAVVLRGKVEAHKRV